MSRLLKWDGHTHTQFCYHGSPGLLEDYIEKAIELGFERYTVTEHSPVPDRWVEDNSLLAELAMPYSELASYFAYVDQCKDKFNGRIEIVSGLELDYLHGATDFTDSIISEWKHKIDDVVYSVHYLPGKDGMYCVDYTSEYFIKHLLSYYGTIDKVIDAYYDHIEHAIKHAGTFSMRKRIGHINLIRKFEHSLPSFNEEQINKRLLQLIPLLKKHQVGIDVNIAGLRVATCGQAYVPPWFIAACQREDIMCVYGSDAHRPEQVGLYWDWFSQSSALK